MYVCLYVCVCMCVCVCHACFGSVVGNKRKIDDRPQYSMYTDRVTRVCLQSSFHNWQGDELRSSTVD